MSRRARIGLVVALAIAVALMVGQLLVPATPPPDRTAAGPLASAGPPSSAPAAATPAPAPPRAPGARRSQDAAGAKEAAADFARSYGDLVALDEDAAVAAKRAMVASGSAERLVTAMRGRLAALHRVWPVGAVTYRVAPLAVRVRMDGPAAAEASVWYVGVVAAPGLTTYEEWVTQSYRLVWERSDWRIAEESDAAGPRPDPGRQPQSSAAELEARLAGFESLL